MFAMLQKIRLLKMLVCYGTQCVPMEECVNDTERILE